MEGCGDIRLQVLLVGLGIVHMLVEWALGKRAARTGGPGSLLAVIALVGRGLYSLAVAIARRAKYGRSGGG
jgi:hypothetical protein